MAVVVVVVVVGARYEVFFAGVSRWFGRQVLTRARAEVRDSAAFNFTHRAADSVRSYGGDVADVAFVDVVVVAVAVGADVHSTRRC